MYRRYSTEPRNEEEKADVARKSESQRCLPERDEEHSPRVPKSLQNIFSLAAQGKVVTEAPTDRAATRIFRLLGKNSPKLGKKKSQKKVHRKEEKDDASKETVGSN
jgi:hypothetical protein